MTRRVAAHRASPSFTISWSLLRLMPIESVMPSNHLILFSCPQSFPASGSFPMSRLSASGGQSIGTSAWVLPMKIQGWFSLRLTGLISLLSRDSQEAFPAPQIESIKSSPLNLLFGPTLTFICILKVLECVFCHCWVVCSTNVDLLVNGVVEFFYIFADFLFVLSLMRNDVEISNCNWGFVYFLLLVL